MNVLLVIMGAAVGAPLRYLADQAVKARYSGSFPFGTLVVNVAGSGLLGFLVGLPAPTPVMAALGSGLCGALTTYSTFGYETVRLTLGGERGRATLYALGSVALGLAAAWGGLQLGRW
ncbi:MAG: CrcB family protein [Thermoactinospora sp.]|nr:CrcB family protein [Thermoactinospora sp.]